MFKTIINSLYGITFELTAYLVNKKAKFYGKVIGQAIFNPIASYITALPEHILVKLVII